jgi:hypothetical protein
MQEATVLLVSRDQSLAQTIRAVCDSIPRLRLETALGAKWTVIRLNR